MAGFQFDDEERRKIAGEVAELVRSRRYVVSVFGYDLAELDAGDQALYATAFAHYRATGCSIWRAGCRAFCEVARPPDLYGVNELVVDEFLLDGDDEA